jgi:hypothetical protein
VVNAGAGSVRVFVEAGGARVADRHDGRAAAARPLAAGEFYAARRAADAARATKGEVAARPTAEFLAAVPPPFRDRLPPQRARFTGKPPPPKRLAEIAYADAADWLATDAGIRQHLVPRWRPRLADPAFRAALAQNLAQHPEWDPILFPEKYRPTETTAEAPAGPAAAKAAPAVPGAARAPAAAPAR